MQTLFDFMAESAESAEFNDSLYIRSHGNKPHGNGSWVFSINPNGDITNDKYFYFSKFTSLSKAKDAAKRYFPQSKSIWVMP